VSEKRAVSGITTFLIIPLVGNKQKQAEIAADLTRFKFERVSSFKKRLSVDN